MLNEVGTPQLQVGVPSPPRILSCLHSNHILGYCTRFIANSKKIILLAGYYNSPQSPPLTMEERID